MFEFAHPLLALLIPLPLLLRRIWPARRVSHLQQPTARNTLRHPNLQYLQAAFKQAKPKRTQADWLWETALWLAWVALVIALMNPRWLEQHDQLKSQGYDLMLALDGSRSMEALDFSSAEQRVSRMAVVKGVTEQFIQNRVNDRLGIILFGDLAYVLSPISHDLDAIRQQLANVQTRMAGDGTAIGDAIGLAVDKLRQRPEGSRVLVLLTDGENTSGSLPPLLAARLAAQFGVRIFSIGVGSDGAVLPAEPGQSESQTLKIDEELLRQISQLTGGAYFRATNTNTLTDVYRQIDQLEKSSIETQRISIPTSYYRWPLGLALLILAWMGMHPGGNRRRFSKAKS